MQPNMGKMVALHARDQKAMVEIDEAAGSKVSVKSAERRKGLTPEDASAEKQTAIGSGLVVHSRRVFRRQARIEKRDHSPENGVNISFRERFRRFCQPVRIPEVVTVENGEAIPLALADAAVDRRRNAHIRLPDDFGTQGVANSDVSRRIG